MVLIMNSVDIKDILRFCDYLDKNGDYTFSDQILNRIASNSKNIKTASNKKLSSQEKNNLFIFADKYISYRLAEDEGKVSQSIIDQINKRENPNPSASNGAAAKVVDKVKDKVKDVATQRNLLKNFFSAMKNIFPKFSSQLSSLSNTVSRFTGPVIGTIFLIPSAHYWITRISQEEKEALDSKKEIADFASFISAVGGTIALAVGAVSTAPSAGTGTITGAGVAGVLYTISALLSGYGFIMGFSEKDDPYDNLPTNKKPKKEEAKPSEAPKQNTSTPPSKPSAPSSTSAPSAPRRQPSKPAENDSDKIWYDKVNKNIKDIVFD
jgi:hypothetical protein